MNPLQPVQVGAPLLVASVGAAVAAGFPSPAEDCVEPGLDLTRRFVRNAPATFVVEASGDSLIGLGILAGDILLVDRSREPRSGDVIVALVDGAFTAKQYLVHRGVITLAAANPEVKSIPWQEGCEVWGVVASIHRDLVGPHRS